MNLEWTGFNSRLTPVGQDVPPGDVDPNNCSTGHFSWVAGSTRHVTGEAHCPVLSGHPCQAYTIAVVAVGTMNSVGGGSTCDSSGGEVGATCSASGQPSACQNVAADTGDTMFYCRVAFSVPDTPSAVGQATAVCTLTTG